MSKKEPKKQRRRQVSKGRAIWIASLLTLLLAIGVYSTLEDPDKVIEGAYELENFAITVKAPEGFSGEVVDNVKLIVYGDKSKVTKMRKSGEIPDVVIPIDKRKEGIYEGTPEVSDTKFGVKYKFEPAVLNVKLAEANEVDKNIFEHGYGLTAEGYKVDTIVASEKAKVIATPEQEHLIGQIVVEVDVTGLSETTTLDGQVIILDKRGEQITNLEIKNPVIPTTVNIEPMGWLQTEMDIANLEKEIKTLEQELKNVREEEVNTTDVLQKADLKREIQFRETRLQDKNTELVTKRNGLVGQKEIQEEKKKQEVKKSVLSGGKVVDDKPDKEEED